ncbi:hypothetical protein [Simiduia agarivorans]|uniref:Ubiquinone biosynthesis hydroxylase UbiH/UbiF/VisC/COQ6 n=1 Tax=Simiduia agarivorans (strain DSM 21679 / JCM 13881 / BCRC 17597 / SA1) TaxID=1117647 RepID=K4KML7_SIMAS|nr:hypothetical protein [Simiduia agarivorans]AFU99470.1 ubiquinone biosynthesis hydroxylase UbiH/UbiF/VisC/COQ6 [Simiduia agarivorans SA1 = DSM 21679]
MFAILLSEKMDPFYQNIASFPTFIFTFFLLLTVLYWLVAVLGFVSIDVLDFDIPDVDGDLNAGSYKDLSTPDVLAGLMLKFGLHGVPVTIIISLVSLVGWLISYYATHFLIAWIEPGIFRYVLGLPILLGALWGAVMTTALLIKPLRPLFLNARQQSKTYIIGQTAVIRSSYADASFGEALLADGGAGLLLNVRADEGVRFKTGDRVVIISHDEASNLYRIVSEQEFSGM